MRNGYGGNTLIADKITDKEGLIRSLYPGARVEGRKLRLGDINGESGTSFVVMLDTGQWHEWNAGPGRECAAGGTSGDIVMLLQERLGLDIKGVYHWLKARGYIRDYGAPTYTRPAPRPKARQAPAPMLYRPGSFSVNDVLAADIWYVSTGKKPWTGVFGGELMCFRQSISLSDGRDAVEVVRRGGYYESNGKRLRVLPHKNYDRISQSVAALGANGTKPALSLAGSAKTPCPLSLFILDCDYKPDKDTDGSGRFYRDYLRDSCAARGFPVFRSSRDDGFHSVFAFEGRMYSPETGQEMWISAGKIKPPSAPSITIDLFAPGALRAVVLCPEKPEWEFDWAAPVPAASIDAIKAVILDAEINTAREVEHMFKASETSMIPGPSIYGVQECGCMFKQVPGAKAVVDYPCAQHS